MTHVFLFLFIVVSIIIGISSGVYKNEYYPKKYANKKATEIKCLLEYVYKMECALNVDDAIIQYSKICSKISELISLKDINPNAFAQVLELGKNRYKKVHNMHLTFAQQQVLSLNEISLRNAYSQSIIRSFRFFCHKQEELINRLKTDAAKERKRQLVIDNLNKCVIELNQRGIPEYIIMITEIVTPFDINIDIKRTSDEECPTFTKGEYVRKINNK